MVINDHLVLKFKLLWILSYDLELAMSAILLYSLLLLLLLFLFLFIFLLLFLLATLHCLVALGED